MNFSNVNFMLILMVGVICFDDIDNALANLDADCFRLIKESFDLNMVFANRLLACMERPDPMHQGSSQYLHCVIEAKETENGLRESVERQMVENTVKMGMEALTVCAYETGTFQMETWASTEERN